MGRLIDVDKIEAYVIRTHGDEDIVKGVQYVLKMIDKTPTVEAIPKADYETHLKADIVAMLEELKEQLRVMHEKLFEKEDFDEAYGVSDSMDVIEQKIDSLKGGKDEMS